jgi:hypothetical protein
MQLPLRPCLIMTAILAVGGCAAKPPQPEATTAPSTPAASPPPTSARGSSTPSASTPAPAASTATVSTPAPSPPAPLVPTPPSPLVAHSSAPAPSPPVSASAGTGSRPTATGSHPASAGGGASADHTSASAGAAGSSVPPARARTAEERRSAIDKRLNDSLGSFDAKLRKEQQKLAQERDARQATVATVAASDSSGKPGAEQTAEAAGSATTEAPEKPAGSHPAPTGKRGESRAPHSGDLKSDKDAGRANEKGNGAVANEIPDGSDDDVVARRLRKAAEQETDPELKDKLWKEYVEYKKNAQGK